MAASSALDVVNHALMLIGEPPLSALPGTTAQGLMANTVYESVRDEILTAHLWNEAIVRVTLESTRVHAITGVDTGTKTFTIAGDYAERVEADETVTVSDSTGNDGNYPVVSATENAGSTDIVVEGTIPDATVDGDLTASDTVQPAWGYSHAYFLPTDFLRFVRMRNPADRFRIEGSKLLANNSSVSFLYVSRTTDVSKWRPSLFMAVAYRLASFLAKRIRANESLANDLYQKSIEQLGEARYFDSLQSPTDRFMGTTWVDARYGGSGDSVYRPVVGGIEEPI